MIEVLSCERCNLRVRLSNCLAQDYHISSYIAEFINTLSSLGYGQAPHLIPTLSFTVTKGPPSLPGYLRPL